MFRRPHPVPGRLSRVARALPLLLLGALIAVPAISQQPPRFRSQVELIQFQVSIADGSGAFVPGLTAEDFAVRINGQDREVSVAYEVDLGTATAGEGGGLEYDLPSAAWRQWVLLFDASFTSPRGVKAAQAAALEFLDNSVLPQDLVGAVTYSVVEGVRMVVPLTSDHRQVRAAIEQLGLTQATRRVDRAGFLAETITGGMVTPISGDEADESEIESVIAETLNQMYSTILQVEKTQYQDYVARYAEQIGILGNVLQAIHGRKHVVFFTNGFDDSALTGESLDELAEAADLINAGRSAEIDADARFGSPEVRSAIDDAIRELVNADTVMHMVDTAGVGGGAQDGLARGAGEPGSRTADMSSGRDSLIVWADGTDGTLIWNENDLGAALASLEQANRQYYVLGVQRRPGDPAELEVDVAVRRAGVEVTAAPSRFAPTPVFADMNDMQRQAQLAEFISKGTIERDLEFSVSATAFEGRRDVARVGMVIEVPWDRLQEIAAERGDGKVGFDLLGYVMTEDGEMVDLTDRHIDLDINRMAGGPAAGLPLRIYDLMWSPPGNHMVRALLRDDTIGRLSSASATLDVPSFGGDELGMTTPMVLDAEHPGLILKLMDPAKPPTFKSGGPVAFPFMFGEQELTPTARFEVAQGKELQVYFIARNLTRAAGGQPNLGMNMELIDSGGQAHQVDNPSLLGRNDLPMTGEIELVLGGWIPAALAPGYYQIKVSLFDQANNTAAEKSIPLWVVAGG